MADSGERRSNTVTIRWSLIRNLSLLLVGLTGLVLLATVFTGRQVERFVSTAMLDRVLDAAQSDLRRFVDPVERVLSVARRLVLQGSLDPNDPEALTELLEPLLAIVPQLSSVNVGDERGRSYLLLHAHGRDAWRTRVTRIDEWGPRVEYREWGAGQEERVWSVEEPSEDEAYDPRRREWFQVAIQAAAEHEPGEALPEGLYWTDPYTFFTTGEPGITAMTHMETPDGRRWILAIDLLLQDVSDFTRGLEVTENGYGAVLSDDGRILGVPGLPRFEDEQARRAAILTLPIDSEVPTLHAAALEWERLLPDPPASFPFRSGGFRYWADARSVPLGLNFALDVVIVVPSRDLVGPVVELQVLVVAVSLLGFGSALVMAFALARRYSRPLSELVQNSERIGALDLERVAPVATTLREVDQLATEQERMRVALDSFSRYVPLDVVRELMSRGEAARIGGARCEVTALFTDIRGFTSVAEGMDPEQLTAHLADYFEELLGVVQGDGYGTVTQLTGDGLIGFWGAPRPDEEHAAHAAAAVLACEARIEELNPKWRQQGRPELHTRFGLATGVAVVGNVGATSRLVYTAIGDTINLASRLEGLGRFYGTSILASDATRRASGEAFTWREVDTVRVKGRSQGVRIHELLGAAGSVPEERLALARRYEACLADYRERRFAEAREGLERLAKQSPDDLSVARLLDLARVFEAEPPSSGWDAVTEFTQK